MTFKSRSMTATMLSAALLALPLMIACSANPAPASAAAAAALPSPAIDASAEQGRQKAVLAGGCFWGVQGVFAHVKGVDRVVSGYSGGTEATANYNQVSSGRTGHAEAVEITYDPSVISYGQILRIFFSVATDPTQLNMQFPDEGPQYRNEIFAVGPEQQKVAAAYIQQLGKTGAFKQPIVTKVSPLKAFYPAEANHQDYLFDNPRAPYIMLYDAPKLKDLQARFPDRWRAKPVLVRAS